MHVHVHHTEGGAKFWLEPNVEIAQNYGLSARRLTAARWVTRKHEGQIRAAWKKHFDR